MKLIRTLDNAGSFNSKRVIVRADLNVPMNNGVITDATRIVRTCPTIKELSSKCGKVIILSHFGRPKGKNAPEYSLKPLVDHLQAHLGLPVEFAHSTIGDNVSNSVAEMTDGSVLLLENTRFHEGEETNDPSFANELAKNGDIFVNDAFSTAHRAHASTEGIAHILPSYAGRSMEAELTALNSALSTPIRPVMALVGGAKVSTKIELLENLIDKVEMLTIGGGMANTFLAARGINVGSSLCEREFLSTANRIISKAKSVGCEIILPVDAVIARELKEGIDCKQSGIAKIPENCMILDAGDESIANIIKKLEQTKTLLWNGPLGAFEIRPFDKATISVAKSAADLTKSGKLITVAGGGDTVAALSFANVVDKFTYVSTAGGAFLEWIEGKELPGIKVLEI